MTDTRFRRSTPLRCPRVLLGRIGLAAGVLLLLLDARGARAGTEITTNACLSNATATFSDIDIALAGSASPDPATVGEPITLGASSLQASVPADLLIAGYNLGLLQVGVNSIPVNWWVARSASNTAEGQVVRSGSVGVNTTISDPDGTRGTGDETATPLNVNVSLPNTAWTPTGGDVEFRQGGTIPTIPGGVAGSGAVTPEGSVFFSASVAGGLIRANFDCRPGLTDADGPDDILGNADDATTFFPFGGSGGEASNCAAKKLKAAGKAAACLLGVNAKAAKKGEPADGEKVQKCKDKLAGAFAKAEDGAGCLTLADAAAVEAAVEALVGDVTAAVDVAPDPSKCQARKLKAAGKRAKCLLALDAKEAKTGNPKDPDKMLSCGEKFSSVFAKAEEQGDCGTATGDAGSIGSTVDLFVGDMDGNLFPSDPGFAPFETVVVNAP